jgi:hypothetical protein
VRFHSNTAITAKTNPVKTTPISLTATMYQKTDILIKLRKETNHMSHEANTHYDETINEYKEEQTAPITLSRSTLERLQFAYNDLTPDELDQVEEALKDMQEWDNYEPIKEVPLPKGTIKHPDRTFEN